MKAKSYWKAWLDAHKSAAAARVVSRLAARLAADLVDLSVEPYHKGGFVASWWLAHEVPSTDGLIVDAIRYGQRLATGWILMGSIDRDPCALASVSGPSHISIAGVSMMAWALEIAGGT